MKEMNQYQVTESGEFIINNYNSTKLFSSFFPGIAGKEGIPMWLFYVNRGQCVCSMGIKDKEHPIMEFLPANRAYQLVSSQGFRTFIKPLSTKSLNYYEPFQKQWHTAQIEKTQKMFISSSGLTIIEENQTLGLEFKVEYFTVPEDEYAGLVRKLSIKNLNTETFAFEGLDGLPLIIPYGINNFGLKFIRRLMEAFVEVSNYENGVPFFRGKVEPSDRPEVVKIKKGNFYIGFEENNNKTKLIKPIVDPVKIFGSMSDYSYPENFLDVPAEKLYENQILENRLPCSMGYFNVSLAGGETYTYTSIIGHASSIDELNSMIPRITQKEYIQIKTKQNNDIIEKITQNNFICSSQAVLDQYTRQNFLDNTLRGGFPHTLQSKSNKCTIHLYSRKHGDLERDYNDYRLAPTYYSQGNGNFRDVNQNRRNDLLFNPDVQDENVKHFYNLIQLDGFNPLVIKEKRYRITNHLKLSSVLENYLNSAHIEAVKSFLQEPFTPGELMTYLLEQKVKIKEKSESFISDLVYISEKIHDTDYGEGFWTDHWTYNLDLLENYLAVYPEKLRQILLENQTFTFYDNPHRVQPRDEKFVIWDNNPMQLGAVVFDEEKERIISERKNNKNHVHTEYGKGQVYRTTLLNSLLCLIVNKMASLDPEGVGVLMETDKPNWYDALNGLPGLIGSSISETLEIKRHILFVLKSFEELHLANEEWFIFEELKEFMAQINEFLNTDLSPFEFWEKSSNVKEAYRKQTRLGISGKEKKITIDEIKEFLTSCLRKLDKGIEKAWDNEKKVISTYFINEVVEYEEIKLTNSEGKVELKRNPKGFACFRAKKFIQKALPLFLEGPVHYLRCHQDLDKARFLANHIKKSGLYDQKLRMYKVNESLSDQPMEIGRARTFSPGWFENESIWLHMEYKYMLELIRSGLYEEFYDDFTKVFVPFFKPEIYGRSILENSSFIVSSANPDSSIHGNGFVARLSGATAEFIQILMTMAIGSQPFKVNTEGELELHLNPVLAGWLFTKEQRICKLFFENEWREIEFPKASFSFMFLGSILVTYKNPDCADTFGANGKKPSKWEIIDNQGRSFHYEGAFLKGNIVEEIRNKKISRINIELS